MGKISSVVLTITTTISLSGLMGLMPVAQAQSVSDLQAQIAALQASLSKLQGGSRAMTSTSYTHNLTVGSKGDDVKALQNLLISKSYLAAGLNTGYFGSLTKAAVAKWQKDAGISPAVGYVGPKSRAALNAMVAPAPAPVTGPGPGPVVAVPGSGLAVSVASDTKVAMSIIAGASRVSVVKVNLTASNVAPVNVTGLKFKKLGVVSDTNVSSAYLVEMGKVIAQYSSISGGVITFSGLGLAVGAGVTRSVELAIDLSSSASAGNTLQFGLQTMGDVMADGGVPVSGMFPVNGNVMTVTTVSNPSLASLTIASASVGTSVYAGTQNVLVSQWTLTGNNNAMNLGSIKFVVIGSANKTDLKNVKLYMNGVQVGQTLASVGADGSAYFDLSGSTVKIPTGSSNMQVYADIMGSPSYTFQFELLNSYDVLSVDTQYGAGVAVTINGGSGVQVTINQGQITLTAGTDTPTGNIARGGSGTTLAKFVVYAAGEAVKVKYLDFRLAFTGTTVTIPNTFRNVSLVDDTGLQVGSTIGTPPTSNSCNGNGTAFTAGYNAAGTQYNDCFGTSASPINYIVPANTARTLSLIGDIQTTATFTTVTGSLTQVNGGNLQGLISSQTSNSGAVSGAALTLSTTPLTASLNGALGTARYAAGAAGVRVGSYTLTASSAEGVNVTNMTVTYSASSTNYQNTMVKVGSTQFGSTKSTLTGSDAVTFSGSAPIVVPKGGSITVDIYADILSNASAATNSAVTTLTSCNATGGTTNASISCSPTAVAGQSVTIAGSPTLSVTLDQSAQLAGQMVMGSTGNSLATFKFTDTANVEAIKLNTLVVSDVVSSTTTVRASFTNLTLWQGNTQVGGPLSLTDGGSVVAASYLSTFNFSTPLVVPQNGTLVLLLKGDVASYTSNGATDNSAHSFRVVGASQVTAIGQASNTSATATITGATGNTMTVLKSKLTLTGAVLGSTSGRVRNAADDVATLTFTADPAGDVVVNTLTLKFQGLAVSNGTAINTVRLLSGGTDWNSLPSGGSTCTSGLGNSCSLTFLFAPLGNSTSTVISAGTSKTVTLRLDSSSFFNGANTGDSMSILVNAAGSVDWGDNGTVNVANTTTVGLNLETKVVPLTVGTVSYE